MVLFDVKDRWEEDRLIDSYGAEEASAIAVQLARRNGDDCERPCVR